MKFDERRDEFAFFLGFAARNTEKYLNEAIRHQIQQNYGYLTPNDAFPVCPFNDTLEQILRNYHICVNGKREFLQVHLANLLGEFVFLISDFVPPCCGDGRTFYSKTDTGLVCVECDRCGQIYNLEGAPIKDKHPKRMIKRDFVALWGSDTEVHWAYHAKLRNIPFI